MWTGWWDHVRGNDKVGNRLAMGRPGFFDEVMRFYDRYLLGRGGGPEDPVIAAQGSDGRWREESAFPPADAETMATPLKAGTYVDDARNQGSNDAAAGPGGLVGGDQTGAGAWTFSAPLERATQVVGLPTATVDVAPVVPRTNVVVNVYDVAPDGEATMITRGAALVDAAGEAPIRLFPTDWTFAPGHRIGFLVSGANSEAYTHVPTNTTVAVRGGSVSLPVLPAPRGGGLEGAISPRLEAYKRTAPFTVEPGTVAARTLARRSATK
jgi:predicted acyl esterase